MIQIDMPMPKSCAACIFLKVPATTDCFQCIPDGRYMYDDDKVWMTEKRPNWCPLKEQEKKQITLHKKYVITWGQNDEFSMRKLYEAICETLLDEGELFIARTDDHEKVDFVFYVAEGR